MTCFRYGMSMVEIMIGVVLLALIVVPSLNVIISQTQTVTATRDHSSAAFVAQKIQEVCRSFKFDMLDADQYTDEARKKKTFEWKIKNDDEYRKQTVNGIDYLIVPEETAIDPVLTDAAGPGSIPNVYLLKFTVAYEGKDKRNHRLKISTAISQRE